MGRVAAYVAALVAWSAVVGIPNDPLGVLLWGWLALLDRRAGTQASGATGGRTSLGHGRSTGSLRGLADETFVDVRFDYPVRFDRWTGRHRR